MEQQISSVLRGAAIDVSDVDLEEEYLALLGEDHSTPEPRRELNLPLAPSTPLPVNSNIVERIPEAIAS